MIDTLKFTVQQLAKAMGFAAGFGLIAAAQAAPDRVTVAWDPNPETNIAGYNVYYGVVGSSVTNKVSPGTTTQQQVISLQPQTPYWFYVTAFNNAGLESDPSQVLAYTTPVNQSPTVTLGADRIAILPGTISITAQATDDYLNPSSLTTTWAQISGPATAAVSGGATLNPALQFSVAGTYTFRVTVNDGNTSASDGSYTARDRPSCNDASPLSRTSSCAVARSSARRDIRSAIGQSASARCPAASAIESAARSA